VTAPLCAMWHGHCGNPARLIVDTLVQTGRTFTPLSWLVCADLKCIVDAQQHAEKHGLRHLDTRNLTPADIAGMTGAVAA
jgi:hypothetical protein